MIRNKYIIQFLDKYDKSVHPKVIKYLTIFGIDFLTKMVPEESYLSVARLRTMASKTNIPVLKILF